jgi:hypothetical protein
VSLIEDGSIIGAGPAFADTLFRFSSYG